MHVLDIAADPDDRAAIYRELLPSLRSIVEDEPDLIANLANLTAALYQAIPGVSWVGFYRRIGEDLVLGPFQGKLACTRIGRGKGVCGAAAERAATVLVDDVETFPGHIACDSATRSEIVVPVVRGGQVVAVLDVDSDRLGNFAAVDAEHLAHVAALAAALAW
jgi:L-methionine (R)-S-oxide reductase